MKIKRTFRLLLLFIKFKLARDMIYSLNFWLVSIIDFTLFGTQVLVFSSIFTQVDDINGWNRYQMIFFVGTFIMLDAIYMCFYFFGVIAIPEKIRSGKLDIYMVKPVNTLFYLSFENINPGSLLLAVPGIIMICYSSAKLGINIGIYNVLGFIFLITVMLILMYDLMVIIRSASFWFVNTDALQDFENEMVVFSFRIPGVVFKGIWKIFFYVILPYGLMATIPTKYFTDMLSGKEWIMTISVCAGFTILCQILWRLGMKRYSSASS
jgi:ABC-2 type transport system permease protein